MIARLPPFSFFHSRDEWALSNNRVGKIRETKARMVKDGEKKKKRFCINLIRNRKSFEQIFLAIIHRQYSVSVDYLSPDPFLIEFYYTNELLARRFSRNRLNYPLVFVLYSNHLLVIPASLFLIIFSPLSLILADYSSWVEL